MRSTRETLRDLERSTGRRISSASGGGGGGSAGGGGPVEVPKGAIVREDSRGNQIIELPEYTGSEYADIDWTEFDWDEVYDDVGDEDEDSYGEDAA